MKKLIFLGIFMCISMINAAEKMQEIKGEMVRKIIIESSDFKAEIVLDENPAAQNLAAMLPLRVTFKDFAGKEKITYLPKKLQAKGDRAYKPQKGDLFLYVPWGNIGIFYEPQVNPNGDLLYLGKVVNGLDSIARQKRDFTAKMYVAQ